MRNSHLKFAFYQLNNADRPPPNTIKIVDNEGVSPERHGQQEKRRDQTFQPLFERWKR